MNDEERERLLESLECMEYAFVKNPKGLYVDLGRVPLDLKDVILKMIQEGHLECLFSLNPDKFKKMMKK